MYCENIFSSGEGNWIILNSIAWFRVFYLDIEDTPTAEQTKADGYKIWICTKNLDSPTGSIVVKPDLAWSNSSQIQPSMYLFSLNSIWRLKYPSIKATNKYKIYKSHEKRIIPVTKFWYQNSEGCNLALYPTSRINHIQKRCKEC